METKSLRFNEKLLNLSIKHKNSSVFQHHTAGSQISKTLPCRLVGRGDRGSLSIRLGQVDHWILCSQGSQFLRSCALIIFSLLRCFEVRNGDVQGSTILAKCSLLISDFLWCECSWVASSVLKYQLLKKCKFFINHKTLKIGTPGQVDHLHFEAG